MSSYELYNYSVNSTSNNGVQQISVKPYKEVTSLNVNQLLNDIVGHGISSCEVEFSLGTNSTILEATVKAGFTAYLTDSVTEVFDESNEERAFVIKIFFEEDAILDIDKSTILPSATTPSVIYKNQDYQSDLGVTSPSFKQIFLVLRYNWEEGMLAGTGGTGTGTVGAYARLAVTTLTPQQEYASNSSRFEKTVYLGEILNLGNALVSDGEGDYEFVPSLVHFRAQPVNQGMTDLFANLRKANSNFKIDYNPTMDWIYVGRGKAFIGSSVVEIPEGLAHRLRVVSPLGNVDDGVPDPETALQIADSDTEYDTSVAALLAGQPIEDGLPIPYNATPGDDDTIGQYDVLVLAPDGSVEWIIRHLTESQNNNSMQPIIDAAANETATAYRKLTQAPGWETGVEPQIESAISVIDLRLTKPYIVLAVYKRLYYEGTDGNLKLTENLLPHTSITDTDYIMYEHNPLFPALAVPDSSSEAIITDTLVIPVEEV